MSTTSEKFNLIAQNPLGALLGNSGYLTTWSLVLVIFHKWTHEYFHLVYLTTVVCIGGLILSNVHPRKYVMPVSKTESVVWDGWWTAAIDVFMHIIPLLFVIHTYGTYYSTCSNTLIPLVNSIILIFLYLLHVRNIMAYFRKTGDMFAMYSLEKRYAPVIITCVVGFTAFVAFNACVKM